MNKFIVVSFLILISIFIFTGCNNQEEKSKSAAVEKTIKETQVNGSIVRKGIIDVAAIDKNKDGKVYECPMDWDVISDHSGNCPLCGMNLKEYTLTETEANLDKYDFKHK